MALSGSSCGPSFNASCGGVGTVGSGVGGPGVLEGELRDGRGLGDEDADDDM